MKPEREIIVLGDIEIGGGTLTDDFISDRALSGLISELKTRKHAVDLVLNGDVFDFLKCPYLVNNTTTYPRHITPHISLAKLELMSQAHHKVFKALQQFVSRPKNRLYFIIGNHDHDLNYSQVQKRLRQYLGSSENIYFKRRYQQDQIYIEHGHQYDLLNRINYESMYLNFEGQRILNLPWASFGLISKYMQVKEQFPFMDRIFPRPALLSFNKNLGKTVASHTMRYLLLGTFYYPLRYFFDPTYTFPKKIFGGLFRGLRRHGNTEEVTANFTEKKKHLLKKNQILVFSHAHRFEVRQKRKYVLIQLDCWRDEYVLNDRTGMLTSKPKDYAQILITPTGPVWKILRYPVKRSVFPIRKVVQDELKYLHQAAQEEGYRSKI